MAMNSATMRLLHEKGLSFEDILEVAEVMETRKPDPTNAERQRRHRERKRNAVTVTPVTLKNGEASYREPPVSPKGDTAPQGAKRTRGVRITAGWLPPLVVELPPEARKLASQWPASSYRAEAEGFVNYWLGECGAKACKADWNRTWANRITQVHSKVMRDVKFGNAPANDGNSFLDHLVRKQAGAGQ